MPKPPYNPAALHRLAEALNAVRDAEETLGDLPEEFLHTPLPGTSECPADLLVEGRLRSFHAAAQACAART